MLAERQGTRLDPAGKAAHGQMKVRIIKLHLRQLFSDENFRVQFFQNFPDKGFLFRFAGLDLSAGKFPEILPGAVAPAGGENPVLMGEDGGDYPDGFFR